VRGATRFQVNLVLALSGAVTGALVGFAAGVVPLPDAPAVPVAVGAAVLDALRVPVLAVRRQVPQYWGRIFGPRLVALLYGARLGVGPLTLLPTWLWWAAIVVGATRGPWAGAATGATFAVVRTVTMWIAGTRARSLDRADRPLRLAIAAVALVALAACSGDDDDDSSASAPASTSTTDAPTIELEPSTTTTTTPEDTALGDLLIDEVLGGYSLVRDDVLDLDAAAQVETRGFVRGFARTWTDPQDDVVFVTAYEFGSAQQAELYLVDGAETLTARGAERFDVPDVPGAFGFTTVEDDFVAHAVAFTRGHRWLLVLVGSSTGGRTVDEAIQMATLQSRVLDQ
jgi:hypothetical protein